MAMGTSLVCGTRHLHSVRNALRSVGSSRRKKLQVVLSARVGQRTGTAARHRWRSRRQPMQSSPGSNSGRAAGSSGATTACPSPSQASSRSSAKSGSSHSTVLAMLPSWRQNRDAVASPPANSVGSDWLTGFSSPFMSVPLVSRIASVSHLRMLPSARCAASLQAPCGCIAGTLLNPCAFDSPPTGAGSSCGLPLQRQPDRGRASA